MGAYVSKTASQEKQEAAKAINELLESAQSLVWEAESIADTHDLSFSVNFGAYGMGGSYSPVKEGDVDEWGDPVESGWNASSQSC
ncbi:hypothetical protein psageK4_148 [Pseudomonas phage psageK4]|uniref:Uncharacterized protein n=2 Tax=Otagovirus TaxID=2560197 RepID=A0AAE8XMN5_9CAUD|nr:hypothetical protein QGX14_gp087 [Pseudomonas phage psageK4]YP_010767065.1 hypothetical protein QGX15_gp087 [Pseudomonas phage psageK4e]QXV71802.1 hypothetical protein psageK4_148 [Pseudomonas phage psageK4]UAW53608.1 hypothetical protein psageK4e_160 [Pseudomonas phage psageK4e]